MEQETNENRVMEIVYVANVFPYPPTNGHSIRNYNLLKRVGQHHNLHLRLLVHEKPTEEQLIGLLPFVKSLRYYVQPEVGAFAQPLRGLRYWLRGIPPDLRFSMNHALMQDLRHFIDDNEVDILQIEDPSMALYVNAVPKGSRIRTVLTFHDINFKKYERISKLEPSLKRKLRLRFHSHMMRKWEPKFAANFTRCVTMSDVDRELLLEVDSELKVHTIPNGVDTELFQPFPEKPSSMMYHLLFVGNMDYRPNIEAVKWFTEQVMPWLDQSIPNYMFWIVGVNPREEVLALKSAKVQVTGRVPDVRPYYENANVVIVPLFAGGGTRLKILEAMSLGRPVVSTTIGAEGLELIPGQHLLIADDVQDFRSGIEALIQDDMFRQNMVAQGRDCVVDQYDWGAIAEKLEKLYLRILR